MSSHAPRRRTIAGIALILALGVTGCQTGGEPPPVVSPTQQDQAADWSPQGAPTPIVVAGPDAGPTQTIRVGDRIQVSSAVLQDAVRVTRWAGLLVPYGGEHTYLAVAPGTVVVEKTRYDHARPCLPPQPVGTSRLIITGAPASAGARHLTPDDAGSSVVVHPGQRLTVPVDTQINVVGARRPAVISVTEGVFALRPGTATLELQRRVRPTHEGRYTTHTWSVTVTVVDHSRQTSAPPTTASAAAPAAQVLPAAAAVAPAGARPACG